MERIIPSMPEKAKTRSVKADKNITRPVLHFMLSLSKS
jgi:hypothetical protein